MAGKTADAASVNLLEICQAVLAEIDGDGSALTTAEAPTKRVHKDIVRWVKQEYERVQRKSSFWLFLQQHGLFLTTEAGVATYTKTGIREIVDESLYLMSGTAQWPISLMEYSDYLYRERIGDVSEGTPLALIWQPDKTWRLWPAPDKVFTVYADWTLLPQTMTLNSDEPLWEEAWHYILVWGALKKYATEMSTEAGANLLLPRIQDELPALMRTFHQRYLPEVRLYGPLL